MDTEIELKYLVNETGIEDKLDAVLNSQAIQFEKSVKSLNNCYFDTADLTLRKHDIGLRVRRTDDYCEQTVKTSGTVAGGLHKRPEYNVSIDARIPDLSLFPNNIWPEGLNVDLCQSELISLFSTDFNRTRWLLSFDNDDKVELAFDNGAITANGEEVGICELEIELVEGEPQRLLEIAYLLTSHFAIRPGHKSKAARGYQLFSGSASAFSLSRDLLVPLKTTHSVGHSCVTGLLYVIDNIQQTIDEFFREPTLDLLTQLTDYLALIRHGLWLYKNYLPAELVERIQANLKWSLHELTWVEPAKQIEELTAKTGHYRKKIEYSQSLIKKLKLERRRTPDLSVLESMFYSENFNHLQLDLLQLMLLEDQLAGSNGDNDTLITFANRWLEKSLGLVKSVMGSPEEIEEEVYLAEHRTLVRSLLTGFWFGNLYSASLREAYRNPWFDLKQGVDELETLWFLKHQIELVSSSNSEQAPEDQPEKLASWLTAKIDTLMVAMEQSRQAGLQMLPYWRG